MNQPNARYINTKNFMSNLRQRCLKALAVRMSTDSKLQTAIRRDTGNCLLLPRNHRNAPSGIDRRAMSCLLTIHRNAKPNPAAIRLAPLLPLTNLCKMNCIDG
jgi:hypothetical protein